IPVMVGGGVLILRPREPGGAMSVPAVRPLGSDPLILFELELSKIKENPNNARKHSRKQLAALKGSVAQFGPITPVVVDEHGQLLCGHARISAAKALGMRAFPAVQVRHLSERQKRAFMLADNRIAQLASWDEPSL